ncbi:unnamed protein product [Moneuplotes crassus]|uniref:Uncharacterized protein n=1 Tax=Euplotes crassus TaxID=5936 RepID=A0AAD1Y8Q4_EUPCR|nr:unnamed protein product [Moneuplotes crassus]
MSSSFDKKGANCRRNSMNQRLMNIIYGTSAARVQSLRNLYQLE